MRQLRGSLAEARDGQIHQVVAMVDALPERGGADALLTAIRPRLAKLRPYRPLRFGRLLFRPLDPVIVPATRWRRGQPLIPRSALPPLTRQIRGLLGPEAAAMDATLEGRGAEDAHAVLAAGTRLWPMAAALLAGAAAPPGWSEETGLAASDHAALAGAIAALLGPAAEIEAAALRSLAGEPPDNAFIRQCLAEAAAAGPLLAGMLLFILLARLPVSDGLLGVAGDLSVGHADAAIRDAADKAIDLMLEEVAAGPLGDPDLTEVARETARIADLLDALERPGPANRPARRSKVAALRREVAETCRARFGADMAARILQPVAAAEPTDAEVETMEQAARELHRFEQVARRIGGGDHYARALRSTEAALRAAPGALTDRARLVEILLGPDAAMAMLAAG